LHCVDTRISILVRPKVDLVAVLDELVGAHLSPFVRNDLICVPMAHEDGRLLVGAIVGNHVLDLLLQQQVATQAEDAAQLVLVCNAGQQRHSSTLREASNDDAIGGYALCNFLVDEGVEVVTRLDDALFILLAVLERAQRLDIVPSWHAHAHVLGRSLAIVKSVSSLEDIPE
jgi:hypothetical protein